MENDLYTLALSHYQKGEYEDAFNLLKTFDVKGSASNKERVLLEACKKQISEQYYFLIVNHISQQEYHKATQLQNDFLEKYNFDERIMRITIPKVDTKIEETNKKPYVPFNLLLGIGLVVLMGIVAWWILQSNEKEYSIQDIETISQQNQNTENYNPEVEGNTGATPQQRNENIEAPSTTNQFEYINEKRGNYEVDIEFPVSLAGMKDVSGIQLAIAQKAFDCNSNDINSCVKKYFKEGAESVSLGEGETAGKVTVKFQQRLNSLYVFKISTYADLGGGTGLSVIYRDEYIYFDKNMNRSLVINDLFNDYSQTLSLVNEHISLDEYASKAKELPKNFIISSSGITFIFPKYSIGYGYQGEVEISLTYEELNNVLSDSFKNAIGR